MLSSLWRFPLWWYVDAPEHFPYLFKNITLIWEDLFAIRLMTRYLFVPMFHDVTVWGRILSIIFRSGRIVVGVISLALVDIFLLIFFGLWFIFPPYFIYREPRAIFLFFGLVLAFAFFAPKKKLKKLSDCKGEVDFKGVASEELVNLFYGKKTTYDLLGALLTSPSFQHNLTRIGLDYRALSQEILKNEQKLQGVEDTEKLRTKIIEKATRLSSENLNLEHLFLVLLDSSQTLREIIARLDFEKEMIEEAAAWIEEGKKSARMPLIWDKDFDFRALGGVNRTLEGTVTPGLEPYIRDITAEARRGVLPSLIERKDLVDEVALILARSGENNVVLVGEPGCGKTYLVYSLAQEIIEGNAPGPLRFKRVVSLDYSALVGGANTEGEILGRMQKIIEEIEYSGNIILFLDEIQNLVAGDKQGKVVYSALEPHLSSVKFQVIAATSFENYHATLEQNSEFAKLFQKVEVPESSEEETMAILKMVSWGFERRQKVTISFPALRAAITLSKQYIHDRMFPDKAVGILDESAVAVASHNPHGVVGKEDVAKVIALKSHIPITKVTTEEKEKLLNLENVLHQRLIDQNEAVVAVSDALRRARAGLQEGKRPIASFLFIGPTGVGKTELARTLAEFYFGSEEIMIRLDMSEFQTKESIYSLIGPPLGQKGSELGGRLTEAVRRRPFALLLLDEMEKAHPDILNLFLQVMDEARLTDSAGRKVDFTNAIIIATSNAGTSLIQEEITKGTDMKQIKEKVSEFLKTIFKPEFLNRFDGIIIFKLLSHEEVEQVASLMIKKLTINLSQKGIKVETTPSLLTKLAERGYDPTLGARPLRRLIQDQVEAKIAKKILKGELKRGSTLVLDESLLTEE